MSASGSSQWTKEYGFKNNAISSSPSTDHNSLKNHAKTGMSSGRWSGTRALSLNSTKATANCMLPQWQTKRQHSFQCKGGWKKKRDWTALLVKLKVNVSSFIGRESLLLRHIKHKSNINLSLNNNNDVAKTLR